MCEVHYQPSDTQPYCLSPLQLLLDWDFSLMLFPTDLPMFVETTTTLFSNFPSPRI